MKHIKRKQLESEALCCYLALKEYIAGIVIEERMTDGELNFLKEHRDTIIFHYMGWLEDKYIKAGSIIKG